MWGESPDGQGVVGKREGVEDAPASQDVAALSCVRPGQSLLPPLHLGLKCLVSGQPPQ